jgi:hypothetical protein
LFASCSQLVPARPRAKQAAKGLFVGLRAGVPENDLMVEAVAHGACHAFVKKRLKELMI